MAPRNKFKLRSRMPFEPQQMLVRG